LTNTKIAEVRQLLIEFSHLSAQQKGHFLNTLNHFMYASPQRRQQIMREWQKVPASASGVGTQDEAAAEQTPA